MRVRDRYRRERKTAEKTTHRQIDLKERQGREGGERGGGEEVEIEIWTGGIKRDRK